MKIIRSLLLIVLTTLNQILNSFFGWTPPECIKCWWHNGTDMSFNYGNLKVLRRRVVSSRNSNVQIVETDNGQPISFHPTRTPRTKKCKIKLYFFANFKFIRMKTWTVLIAATTANRRFFEKFLDKFNKNSVKAKAVESLCYIKMRVRPWKL